jgi:hypothetical protein
MLVRCLFVFVKAECRRAWAAAQALSAVLAAALCTPALAAACVSGLALELSSPAKHLHAATLTELGTPAASMHVALAMFGMDLLPTRSLLPPPSSNASSLK